MRKGSKSAFSLIEVVLACALTSILLVVLGAALSQAQGTFRNVIGTSEASDELRKVCLRLRQELLQTSVSQTSIIRYGEINSKVSLGSPDGQALWFLSNLDADTSAGNQNGTPRYLSDGTPYWQRNILYYVVVPTNHVGLFGWNCTGGAGPDGFDDRCPHKVVIRKEIDFNTATDANPANEANAEVLMTPVQIAPYLTAPVGYKVNAMYGGEAGLKNARIVGRGLLTFRVTSSSLSSITVETRAVSIARARTKVSLGNTSMFDTPYTFRFGMTIVPYTP